MGTTVGPFYSGNMVIGYLDKHVLQLFLTLFLTRCCMNYIMMWLHEWEVWQAVSPHTLLEQFSIEVSDNCTMCTIHAIYHVYLNIGMWLICGTMSHYTDYGCSP